jgi:hypothetical protein
MPRPRGRPPKNKVSAAVAVAVASSAAAAAAPAIASNSSSNNATRRYGRKASTSNNPDAQPQLLLQGAEPAARPEVATTTAALVDFPPSFGRNQQHDHENSNHSHSRLVSIDSESSSSSTTTALPRVPVGTRITKVRGEKNGVSL